MQNLKAAFESLAAGDTIQNRGGKGLQLLVLVANEDGSKQMGTICGCGSRVHGIPTAFVWNDRMNFPVAPSGIGISLWESLEITKAAKVELAQEFSSLATNNMFVKAIDTLNINDPRVATAAHIMGYSNTNDRASEIVAAMRAIGVHVTDEQAAIMVVTINATEPEDGGLPDEGDLASFLAMTIGTTISSRRRHAS